jgi:hypothetical protein
MWEGGGEQTEGSVEVTGRGNARGKQEEGKGHGHCAAIVAAAGLHIGCGVVDGHWTGGCLLHAE